ncbi:MAG: hypothetical protein OQJ96_05885 [Flavobacteriales bacterium]|nr:hypothetical protein [Flavobacteriales bacterium]MCW8937607.1 hypothetical protein [Flavobacteriales bacterium]MCW8968792.1 hypothetical protein [Flavobacteriales bacterium]MCW8990095.1 hypothetical protein [Flavobacteriales bacterium]MCW9019813.1 hypothetical protein [Flavobacteriales bacterium]
MMTTARSYCNLIRSRTTENRAAVQLLNGQRLHGQVMSVLRQELDSMVRCIYLLETELDERERLMLQTLNGERWRNSNNRIITDRDMVNVSNHLWGWTDSVYSLGCAFIHLSNFHDYQESNPFDTLEESEKVNIKNHLNNYHGYDLSLELTFESVQPYLIAVFDKVSSNLNCYVERVENNAISAD